MRRLRRDAATEIGRLLRFLLLRLRSVPANTGGAIHRESGRMLQHLNTGRVMVDLRLQRYVASQSALGLVPHSD
jgi:hypothetical protein